MVVMLLGHREMGFFVVVARANINVRSDGLINFLINGYLKLKV